jgi:hypothetical protein
MSTDGTRLKRLPPLAVVVFFAIAAFIEVSSIAQAIRQESWGPMATTGWLPAVVLASYRPTRTTACRRLRSRTGS